MQIQEVTVPPPTKVIIRPGEPAPQAVYRAFSAQRSELDHQLDQLEDKRRGLTNELREEGAVRDGPAKTGIETRIAEIDKRIADVEKQIAQADQAVELIAQFVARSLVGSPDRRWRLRASLGGGDDVCP